MILVCFCVFAEESSFQFLTGNTSFLDPVYPPLLDVYHTYTTTNFLHSRDVFESLIISHSFTGVISWAPFTTEN